MIPGPQSVTRDVPLLAATPLAVVRRARGADVLAVVLYAAAVAGFFWQPLFLPDVAVPKGGGDLASFLYPAYTFAATNLQRGVLPLWNPYLFGGSPFAADMQSGLYYPPNLLAFLMARPFSYQTMQTLAVFHYLLAAIGAYSYGRMLGLTWAGAFAGGLIYAFGGFNVAHLAHLNMLAAAAWLPLILLLFHKAVTRGALGWAAAAGALYGAAILAGHTQVSLYTAFLLGLYWLWALIPAWRSRRSSCSSALHRSVGSPDPIPPPPGRVALTFPMCLATALGLAAVQLLPLAELLRLSLRADLSYARALEFAASPLGLITLLVPHFFGDSPAEYWGLRWSLSEVYGYAGILTLALAALALWVGRPWHRWMAFFALLAPLALLLSLGEHTVLYGWLYRFIPGFDKVRAAGRFLLLFDLALAVLAGYGIHLLSRPLRARSRPAYAILLRLAGAILAGAVFLAGPFLYHALLTSQDKDPLIFRRVATALDSFNLSLLFLALSLGLLVLYRRRWFAGLPYLALALLLLDLFSANARLNPTTEDVLRGFRHPAIVDYLQRVPEPTRIDTATGAADLWQPDAGLLYGLPDVLGLFNPMALADYQRYWENLGSRSVPGYDLLNAGYLVGRKDVVLDRAKFTLAFDGDPELNVYHNPSVLPRAFVVAAAEVLPREEQLSRLRSAAFEPQRTVLLEPGAVPPADMAPGVVRQIRYPTPNEALVLVDSPRPGYLVLSDVYYPGWRAFADGRELPILRANYVFRAVLLPAGAREVHFVFEPRLWWWGLGISAATMLALAAWGSVRWWLGRSPK